MADEPTPVQNTPEPVAPAAVPATAAVPAPAIPDPAPAVVVEAVKPVADKPADPVPSPIPAEPAPVAEKYVLKIGDQDVNPALIEALTPIFKEAGVTAKQAQGLANAFAAHQQAMIPQNLQRDLDVLRADPELGKLNFGRTQARVNDALAAFTTPQERKALENMGISNNLTLVRMFHRIGTSMQDAPQTETGPRVQEKLPTETKLYGGKDRVSSGASN